MNERSIFLEALELAAPAERAAFLDRACNGDADLRKGVEDLLAVNARSGTFMRQPGGGNITADMRPSEGPGSRVGPYKLLQEIGEGGMGVVYMAEQETPVRRKVALKIIKPGMDSKQVVARFEAERQALGMMDHPNIARVFDAGTTDSGRPYFVMELVHGVPVTEYCDANKLTPRERLELFVPVCQAIQHAHMKGIIHRDVKPSNVLVTMYDDKPVPKVIDFGVAKAVEQRLTEKTLFTQYGALVGTFEYMSPEQAEMNAFGVDTRSDVYSLGVLLYELLTGTTPLERQRLRTAAFGEVVRLIKEEEPPKPSMRISTSGTLAKVAAARKTEPGKLSAVVRGELDWIVMRCLEKDRTRRYDTAIGLARDVERHLAGDAVEACPPTLGYRLKKVYRRNRVAVLVGSAFAFLLLGGVAVSSALAVQASRAERDAEARRQEAVENAGRADENARTAQSNEERAQREAANVRAEQDRTRRLLYASQITSASVALASNRIDHMLQILEDTRPGPGETDLRGWEWHYLDRLTRTDTQHKLDRGLARPPDGEGRRALVQVSTAFSPDNRLCVLLRQLDKGFVIDVCETTTGRRVAQLPQTGVFPDLPNTREALTPTIDNEGKYLFLTSTTPVLTPNAKAAKGDGRKTDIPRFWDVRRGEAIPGPDVGTNRRPGGGQVVIGPDGAWVGWIELTDAPAGASLRGPVAVTVKRWDRATGKVVPTQLTVGTGVGIATLSPDGRSVFWSPRREPKQASNESVFESWDVATRTRRWFTTLAPKTGVNSTQLTRLSAGATAVAILGSGEMAVHRTSDGGVIWKAPLPADRPVSDNDTTFVVSDDGNRIVFKWPYTLAVVENRPGGPPVTRRYLFRELEAPRPGVPLRSIWPIRLLPDGRTLVGLSGGGTLRLWDVSRDPDDAGPGAYERLLASEAAPPGRGRQRVLVGQSLQATRGTRTATATPKPQTKDGAAGPDGLGLGRAQVGPIVVRDGDREVARIELPVERDVNQLQFLESGVLIVQSSVYDADLRRRSPYWAIYDPAAGGQLTAVAEGADGCDPIPNTPYLLAGAIPTWSPPFGDSVGRKEYRILHAATGKEAYVRSAARFERYFISLDAFHPASGRYVEVTRTRVEGEQKIVLHARGREIATGKELWSVELGTTDDGLVYGSRVSITPDGGRFLIEGNNNSSPVNADRELTIPFWSARLSDGSGLREFSAVFSGTRAPASFTAHRGFSPDSREMHLTVSAEVQVWNLESGERTHRLPRHPNPVSHVFVSDDHTRLFTVSRSNAINVARALTGRFHVWDTATDRELFSTPLQPSGTVTRFGPVGFEGGKLTVAGSDWGRVFDGTPVKP